MSRLNLLWTTADMDTIKTMIAMYAFNAKKNGWWDEVNILIWGAATKLVKESEEAQEVCKYLIGGGVTLEACKACAELHNAVEALEGVGVKVWYTGQQLTSYLKGDDGFLSV